jgi:hypothetical protein
VANDDDPWTAGGTYTREQIAAFRDGLGPSRNGNGAVAVADPPASDGPACSECGGPLPAEKTRFGQPRLTCSAECARTRQNRLHNDRRHTSPAKPRPGRRQRRQEAPVVAQEAPKPVAVDDDPSWRPGALHEFVHLTTVLPAGWELRASSNTVTLAWSPVRSTVPPTWENHT